MGFIPKQSESRLEPGLSVSGGALVGTVGGLDVPGPRRILRGRSWVPASPAFDVCVVGLAGLVAATVGSALSGVVAAALVLWIALVYRCALDCRGALQVSAEPMVRHAGTVVGLVAVLAATDAVPAAAVWGTAGAVGAGGVAALATRAVRRAARGPVKVVVVGDAGAVEHLTTRWARHGIDVVAACIPDRRAKRRDIEAFFAKPFTRSVDAVSELVQRHDAEVVAVVPGEVVSPQQVRRLGWSLEKLPVHLGIVGLPETWAPHRLRPARLGRHPLVEVRPSRRGWLLRAAKEVLDRVGGSLLLLLSLPVLAVTAVAIRLDSEGPVFFSQRRVGVDGREFTMYKLRTMCTDAERLRESLQQEERPDAMLFKLERDPRITRVGGVLRKLSIDELPQLLNVVKGDMSLIGPRPALPEEVARYDDDARRRLAVKPGLTGLWQVSGRSDLSWEDSLALDLHYVDNWRLTDDAVIAGRTFGAVLSSRGAY